MKITNLETLILLILFQSYWLACGTHVGNSKRDDPDKKENKQSDSVSGSGEDGDEETGASKTPADENGEPAETQDAADSFWIEDSIALGFLFADCSESPLFYLKTNDLPLDLVETKRGDSSGLENIAINITLSGEKVEFHRQKILLGSIENYASAQKEFVRSNINVDPAEEMECVDSAYDSDSLTHSQSYELDGEAIFDASWTVDADGILDVLTVTRTSDGLKVAFELRKPKE